MGSRINALALPRLRTRHDDRPTGWQRWAKLVVGHPWRSIVAGLAILTVLATPIRLLHLGQTDVGALPTDTQARQAYDIMSAGFGSGSNGPILVAVAPSSSTTSTSDPRLGTLRREIERTPGVKSITPPLVNHTGTAAVFTVISDYAPSDRKTEDLVRTLRDDTIPNVTRGQQTRVDVGGTTAGYIDLASQISSKLPTVIAIVLSLSFLLLALAFRSVLVPLKAVIVNLLSTAAAFGVVTYAFGHQWSATAIGLEGSVPIASFVPLMMFAILFGLSMDYEVFLVTRIRERWTATGQAHQAVIDGLAGSARVIAAAGLIMVSVFCAFVISGDPNVKQFGLGMAAAVAVDVSVVRCMIVPAVMSLLGRAAWWLPRWLALRTPDLSLEGERWFEQNEHVTSIAAPVSSIEQTR